MCVGGGVWVCGVCVGCVCVGVCVCVCVCVRRRRVTSIQQPEHSSQYQNQNLYTFNITINVIGLGRYKSFLAQYLKLRPFSETCNMEMYTLW